MSNRLATMAVAVLLSASVVGYWAHPFSHGPLRGTVTTEDTYDLLCMQDVGSNRFTMGGIHLWNPSEHPVEIKRLELDRPVGVRMGRAYVVGVSNQALLGSSSSTFPPASATRGDGRLTWMDPRPVGAAVIPAGSMEDEVYELLVELIRTGEAKEVSVNAVKIEYSTGWRRPYWTRSTERHVIKPDCR